MLAKAGEELHRFRKDNGSDAPFRLEVTGGSWLRVIESSTSMSYLFFRSTDPMPVAVIEDVHGNRLDFTYDSRQQLVEVRDPFRRRLELTYLYGLLSRVVLASQDPDQAGTTLLTCAYDEDGRIVQAVDATARPVSSVTTDPSWCGM